MKCFPEISYVREHIGPISNKKFEFNKAISLMVECSIVQLGRPLRRRPNWTMVKMTILHHQKTTAKNLFLCLK